MARRSGSSSRSAPVRLEATHRVVVLHGADTYLLTERLRQFEAVLAERFGEVERFSYDGTTAPLAPVLDELRSYGLMQRHKLVVVDDADRFLARGDHRAALERYLASPMEESSLVLRASTWNKGKLDALIKAAGTFVPCTAPSPAVAASWCVERSVRAHQCAIEADAAAALVEHIGPALARLDTELAKLAASVDYERSITVQDVDAMTGLVREEKGWEIQHALLTGGATAGMRKLTELLDVSRASEVVVMFALVDLARKVHGAVHLLRDGGSPRSLPQALGLWGPQRNAMADGLARAASRLDSHQAAVLLDEAVGTEQRTRNGYATDTRRALEGLTVLMADTIA